MLTRSKRKEAEKEKSAARSDQATGEKILKEFLSKRSRHEKELFKHSNSEQGMQAHKVAQTVQKWIEPKQEEKVNNALISDLTRSGEIIEKSPSKRSKKQIELSKHSSSEQGMQAHKVAQTVQKWIEPKQEEKLNNALISDLTRSGEIIENSPSERCKKQIDACQFFNDFERHLDMCILAVYSEIDAILKARASKALLED